MLERPNNACMVSDPVDRRMIYRSGLRLLAIMSSCWLWYDHAEGSNASTADPLLPVVAKEQRCVVPIVAGCRNELVQNASFSPAVCAPRPSRHHTRWLAATLDNAIVGPPGPSFG